MAQGACKVYIQSSLRNAIVSTTNRCTARMNTLPEHLDCAGLAASVCSVHLVMKTEADVFTLCHAIKTILTNEHSAHTVSRPPIFCARRIQMARDLLVAVYENNTAHEVVHVLPGSHNMFFKLHLQHVDENSGAFYKVLFCYRDKRPSCPDYAKHSPGTETPAGTALPLSEAPKKRRRCKRSVSVVSDSSNANDSDTVVQCPGKLQKKTAIS